MNAWLHRYGGMVDEGVASSLRGRGFVANFPRRFDGFKVSKLMKEKRDLPRLIPEWYRGRAWIFWTHTVDQRATGWLDDRFHLRFREILCHAQVRQCLACPIYVLMPDHLHVIWIGARENSDQLLATRFLRKELNQMLYPIRLQKQPHDHVLREEEREKSAFGATWNYVAANSERANLVDSWREYPFLGSIVPGYTGLDPIKEDFFESFWRVFNVYSAP